MLDAVIIKPAESRMHRRMHCKLHPKVPNQAFNSLITVPDTELFSLVAALLVRTAEALCFHEGLI